MKRIVGGAIASLASLTPLPATAQTPAPQPRLTAEQALQLFAEAGFPMRDGRAVNRCGAPSNPRVAFIDLNGDGRAEVHVADVATGCYGKPGAYFAILGQQPDGSWKRLIAEDGVVGFERRRTQGWNDLSLSAQNSACPGARQFTGSDYGAPTACAAPTALAAAPARSAAPASASPASATPTALTGSRDDQMAQVLRNVVGALQTRTWESARAAFPGAQWQSRGTHAANWNGSTHTQNGTVRIGNAAYGVQIGGTATQVRLIQFDSPGDDLMEWDGIAAALRKIAVQPANIGCHSPTGFGWVRLTDAARSAVLHKSVNYGSRVPSTDNYAFTPDDPFDGRSEAEVASDRSLC